jgi:hypothetical protein
VPIGNWPRAAQLTGPAKPIGFLPARSRPLFKIDHTADIFNLKW